MQRNDDLARMHRQIEQLQKASSDLDTAMARLAALPADTVAELRIEFDEDTPSEMVGQAAAIVERIVEALNKGDVDALVSILHQPVEALILVGDRLAAAIDTLLEAEG